MTSITETQVTTFTDCFSNEPMIITLGQWLNSCRNPVKMQKVEIINRIRSTEDKETRRRLKTQLPVVCVGAILKDRKSIQHLTGLMQFDIDPTDNPQVNDWPALRDQLSYIHEIMFCGLSASGHGVWGIVKVNTPDRYKEHFEALKADFQSMSIVLDKSKGGNPTDLRYYSFDPNAYIANEYSIYCNLPPPTPKLKYKKHFTKTSEVTDSDKFEISMRYCQRKGLQFADGQKHTYILTFTRVCKVQGLTQSEVENFINNHLISLDEIKSNCVDYPFMDQTNR